MRNPLLPLLGLMLSSCSTPPYDLVIRGGRVMDPETGLDAIRNVGIQGNQIAVITEEEISGTQTLNAGGRVVSRGSSISTSTATAPKSTAPRPTTV